MANALLIGAIVAAVIGLLNIGLPLFLAEYFPVQLLWKQRNGKPTVRTASYAGRTALVTGANGAYGSRAATMFAQHGVSTLVLVDVFDCGKVKEKIETDLKAAGKAVPTILVWQIDMMTFEGCRKLAEHAKTLKSIDHALLTAGILAFNRRDSPEGWETSIQVNFLSTALIALLLIPHLKASPSNPNPPVLTFVTSFGIYPSSFTMGLPKSGSYLRRLSTSRDGMEQGHQYGRSKGALLYFARELATRVDGVTVTNADPGSAWTPLTNPNQSKLIPRLIMNISARDPIYGAATLVNGASAPASANGAIIHDFDEAGYPPFMNRTSGRVAQKRVWEEARAEFEAKVPEVSAVYALLEKK
ncbi:hypothetical protein SEUCBS139899_010053 [Sporothrix eucalyptigena]|uniref:Short chain dehydrogenase reductase n=1 Tax=Sporothrix eucalyptigena TaxID=1812306 RepID=A0ABP0BC43_9PEZI